MTFISFQNSFEKVCKKAFAMSHKKGLDVMVDRPDQGIIVFKTKESLLREQITFTVLINKIDEDRIKVSVEAKSKRHWFRKISDEKLILLEEGFISNLRSRI
jgi:hypothetical protein